MNEGPVPESVALSVCYYDVMLVEFVANLGLAVVKSAAIVLNPDAKQTQAKIFNGKLRRLVCCRDLDLSRAILKAALDPFTQRIDSIQRTTGRGLGDIPEARKQRAAFAAAVVSGVKRVWVFSFRLSADGIQFVEDERISGLRIRIADRLARGVREHKRQ